MTWRPDSTLLLIDESLSPAIAQALSGVGYNATTPRIVFSDRRGVKDPEIIDWLAANDGIWVHADDSARRVHGSLILANNIRTIWVVRPKSGLSAAEVLRLLAYKLPKYLEIQMHRRSPRHFRLGFSGSGTDAGVQMRPYELKSTARRK